MTKADKAKVIEWLSKLQNDLLKKNGDKILQTYSKQDDILRVDMRLSLKGNDATISVSSRIGFTTEKVTDFFNGTLDVKQDNFVFDGEEKQEDENSEEARQGLH